MHNSCLGSIRFNVKCVNELTKWLLWYGGSRADVQWHWANTGCDGENSTEWYLYLDFYSFKVPHDIQTYALNVGELNVVQLLVSIDLIKYCQRLLISVAGFRVADYKFEPA